MHLDLSDDEPSAERGHSKAGATWTHYYKLRSVCRMHIADRSQPGTCSSWRSPVSTRKRQRKRQGTLLVPAEEPQPRRVAAGLSRRRGSSTRAPRDLLGRDGGHGLRWITTAGNRYQRYEIDTMPTADQNRCNRSIDCLTTSLYGSFPRLTERRTKETSIRCYRKFPRGWMQIDDRA